MKGREKQQRRLWRYVIIIFITERFGQSSDPWKRKFSCMIERDSHDVECVHRGRRVEKIIVLTGNIDQRNLRISLITRIWYMLLRVFTRINFLYYAEMSGLPLCALILVFGRLKISWVTLWPTWDSCHAPWQVPEGRNRNESDMAKNSLRLWSSLCVPESKATPMHSQGLIIEMNSQAMSQLAQCLLNAGKCNRT